MLWVIALFAACDSTTESTVDVAEHYLLASVNESALPYNAGSLPPTECSLLIPSGSLRFSQSAQTYELEYQLSNSCTGHELGTSGSRGTWSLQGSELLLRADLGEGQSEVYRGAVRGNRVEVEDRFYRYAFRAGL
jgi:hypothetical protein